MNDTVKTEEEFNREQRRSNILFIVVAVLAVVAALAIRSLLFSSYEVIGTSMYPTLIEGNVVWANKLSTPKRGDIVIVHDKVESKYLIKRVVALEGDSITAEKTTDGYRLVISDGKESFYEDYGVEIPLLRHGTLGCLAEGEYKVVGGIFVMGDNRNISDDSRYKGVFSDKEVVGVVIRSK